MRLPFLPPVEGYDDSAPMAPPISADVSSPGMSGMSPYSRGGPPAPPQADQPDPSEGDFSNQLDAAIEAHDEAMSSGKPPPDATSVAQRAKQRAVAPPPDPALADQTAIEQGAQHDRMSALVRGIETAGHQLTAGVLQQPRVAESVSQLTNEEGAARARADKNSATRFSQSMAKEEAGRKKQELTLDQRKQALAEAHAQWEQMNAAEQAKYKREHDGQTLEETTRHNKADEAIGYGRNKAMVDAAAVGKTLPATSVEGLADLPVAVDQVDELVGTFKRLNMGGLAGKAGTAATNALGLQNTDSAEYNAAALRAMQAAGKILEGGKLAAGDEVKYRKLLPQGGDSPEVVDQKAEGLKTFLRDLAARRSQGLRASGYNVPDSVSSSQGGPMQMRFPDGSTHSVDPADLELARRKGGQPVH